VQYYKLLVLLSIVNVHHLLMQFHPICILDPAFFLGIISWIIPSIEGFLTDNINSISTFSGSPMFLARNPSLALHFCSTHQWQIKAVNFIRTQKGTFWCLSCSSIEATCFTHWKDQVLQSVSFPSSWIIKNRFTLIEDNSDFLAYNLQCFSSHKFCSKTVTFHHSFPVLLGIEAV